MDLSEGCSGTGDDDGQRRVNAVGADVMLRVFRQRRFIGVYARKQWTREPACRRDRFGFSWLGRFAAKSPVRRGWILLDLLGFSRPNLDLSMGYTRFSGKRISRALCRRGGGPGTGASGPGMQRIVHEEELSAASDFLQEIVEKRPALVCAPPSRARASSPHTRRVRSSRP